MKGSARNKDRFDPALLERRKAPEKGITIAVTTA